jgi:tetratricopeptide (TPR) repeat protein
MNKAIIKPGRNDSCPCGSGNKYKHCCGLKPATAPSELVDPREIGALVSLLDRERSSEAEHRARTLLTSHPNAGMLWKILSVALMRQGKDALQALRKTTDLMPQDGEAHGNLGAALHDQGLWPEALVSLRRALAIRPRDVEALVYAADALRALGQAREAVLLYQRALKLSPGRVEAQNNLGNTFLELGQYDAAVDCYRCALEIEPDDVAILCNLSNAQRQLGLLDEALASSRRALTLDPRSVEARDKLADVLRALGLRREVVALYAGAVELDSGRAENHYDLANALFEVRRIEESAAGYARALALQPRHAQAHLGLGVALRAQRRHTDAEASCQAALAIDPNYVEALSLLGELRADRGRFAEAEQLFQRAIEIDPGFSFAYSSIATHRKMTAADTDWLRRAEALLTKPPTLDHEINIRYALGKYFDDVGRYDDAFGHYRRANELTKRYGSHYDRAKLTRRVDDIVGHFDAAFIRRSRTQASPTELPVFIIGMPRSGTSLTEQILASHPAVFGAGEVTFWDGAFVAYRAAEREGAVGASLTPGMARDYLERLTAISGGAARVVDKMPANFLYAGLIHAVFPRARFIHMQRHPIDTCLSIYFQNFMNRDPYTNDLDNLAHYYGEYLRITNHWRTLLPAATLLEIPYEALIEDQEGCTRRMLDFIGLPWDPKCLDFHRTERVVITASKWQVRQKIHASSAGRWRNYEKFVGPLQTLMNLAIHRRYSA